MPYLEQINLPKDLKKLKQEELSGLAEELRSEIIRVCSLGGGHLASSLGAIELTIAMHYLFDSAKDRFVWDVGHQTYAHKIITGRKADIDSIRKPNGLAGFTTSSESEHDALTVGHASTSIAAALGMALARDASGQDYEVLAVIGDGALTGGMALAALNQIGQSKPKLTIILNDNEMSISENVGGLKNHLRSLQVQPWYRRAEERGKVALGPLKQVVGRIKDSTRLFFDPISANPFHAMGIRYVGPIDGHNIDQIIYYLDKIKNLEGPSMLHVITQKGKGYDIAEENPIDWHGASKFNLDHPELAAKGYSWS
ncbi:MAG TPA: 1-deoxy-D-xylulose-5-phosphate synthase, partial [Trueperaceae bacterium]|nr:1-deoxy-D-xylulose-5-phosphate synthase [Trueperaceae bacterium]